MKSTNMDMNRTARFAARTGALGFAIALVLGGALLDGALANTPSGWEQVEPVSTLQVLLIFVLFPIGAALVISLVVLLPGFASKKSADDAAVGQDS